ncbi:MAG TPA: hypothetical protein VI076_14695 [Actinopolymorphaceae bacterium]
MVMDDADGGQRGLRAAPTNELLEALADAYGMIPLPHLVDEGRPISVAGRTSIS